ncbi:MAG: hypothetical protein UT43_C0049G0002 [Parcubacteria group bacterium GW2011_GWC1_39_29]|nr:MAG: hypothetical protein UT43_C0049G0002 [Parcubacteria group bacterium GW2011_GWC1_39_29]
MERPIQGWTHPELREGEVYSHNTTSALASSQRWATARVGEVAYMIGGKPFQLDSGADLYPVFVQRSEIEAAGETIPDWI